MNNSNHFDTAKAVVAFMVVALMAGIFMIFYQYQDNILNSNEFYVFMTLVVAAAGLLIGLMYLIGKPAAAKKTKVHSVAVRSSVKKKSHKKK